MTISDYIQTIVNELWPGRQYRYNRNVDFNINGDDCGSPVVVCIEPDQQYFNMSSLSGNIYDGYTLFIRFLQLIPNVGIAEQAPTRLQVISDQKRNAAAFVLQLSNDDMFIDLPATIPGIAAIEAYDGNWFGYEIQLRNLQVLNPFDICTDPEIGGRLMIGNGNFLIISQ